MVCINDEIRNWADLGVIAGGNFVQLGVRVLIGPLVPLLLIEFGTSKSIIGAILTGIWGVNALCQFPSGVLADRYGERDLLLVALAGTIIGGLSISAAASLPVFAVCSLVLGAGAGLYFSPASALISRIYVEHGGPLGAFTAAGAVAAVVYPVVGTLVSVRFGWRTSIALGAATGLPLLLAIFRFIPAPSPANPDRSLWASIDFSHIRRLLFQRGVLYTVLLGTLVGFAFQSIVSFFPTFLVEYHGVSTGTAGLWFAGLFALSALAQPVAGNVSDRFSRDTAIALSVSVAITGLLLLLAGTGILFLIAGTILLGVGISWPGVLQARFMDQFGDAERGYGFGLVRTVYMLFAASGSIVVGTIAETSGWLEGYGAVILVFAGCLTLLGVNRVFSLEL